MAGGASERVMANFNNLIGQSGFSELEFLEIKSKYIHKYISDGSDLGMDYFPNQYGDAIYETSNNARRTVNGTSVGNIQAGWNYNRSYLPTNSAPWLARGGYIRLSHKTGLFYFFRNIGFVNIDSSFRPILTPIS